MDTEQERQGYGALWVFGMHLSEFAFSFLLFSAEHLRLVLIYVRR